MKASAWSGTNRIGISHGKPSRNCARFKRIRAVFDERLAVRCDAGGQHVGNDSGHRGGAKHVVKARKTSSHERGIHVVEKVVNVLHGFLKYADSQFIRRKPRRRVEPRGIYNVVFD